MNGNPLQSLIMQYIKKLRSQCGGYYASCISIPGKISVQYHGSRTSESNYAAIDCFKTRKFNSIHHIRAYPTGVLKWSDSFRESGINQAIRVAIDRIISEANIKRNKLQQHRANIIYFLKELQNIPSPDIYNYQKLNQLIQLTQMP